MGNCKTQLTFKLCKPVMVTLEMFLYVSSSLLQKRMVLNSNRLNTAITEPEFQTGWGWKGP